ncbi:MAG: hypothetical protein JKY31_10470 [Rhodobacteraceae bacterium]|nr:hypothetical protein [Paracoccaceae bacterium]
MICPLVIDSPQQQEQDPSNLNAIFKFIFSKSLDGQQLILGTITTASVSDDILPQDANLITLSGKYSVLQKEQYGRALENIGQMHEMLLSN